MKKMISVLLTLCLLTGLLAGCILTPESPPLDPTRTAETAVTTQAPETAAPETEPPQTDAPEQTDAPAPPEDTYFVRLADESCDRYSDQTVEILFRETTGAVICRDVETGAEQTLFTLPKDDTINISLIGVTNQRLYFGWNELEDWWGVNVYSVDYQGGNRTEYGGAWDPSFENGWLLLLGFRSDVSPTELLLIDRDDQIAAQDDTGAVWDAAAFGRTVYYLCVEDVPESWPYEDPADGWKVDLVQVSENSDVTVLKVFSAPSVYSPAFFNGSVICFYETDEYYDLFTLEPTSRPTD